jgi:hypothetical protein
MAQPESIHTDLTSALVASDLSAEQKAQLASFKDIADEFVTLIQTLPTSRSTALAITKVDEALHWVQDAIVR